VNNQLNSRTTVPVRKQIWGWRNYGGILRDIYILATPRVRINSVVLTQSVDTTAGTAAVSVVATVNNGLNAVLPSDSVRTDRSLSNFVFTVDAIDRISNAIVGQSQPQPVSVDPNHEAEVRATFLVNRPRTWSPQNPDLYILRATLSREGKQGALLDEFRMNFGFRTIQIRGNEILVNGAPVRLKGAVWNEDYPGKGASLTYEQMERDVALLKSLGVNAIRFAFHPPHPYMLNLCSRYGLFALEELPVWNVPGDVLGTESFQVIVSGLIHEMVQRDQANPSVLAWGIGTDFDSAPENAVRFVDRAAQEFRTLDTRPLYCGTEMLGNDQCASHVDIAALSLTTHDLKKFKTLLTSWKSTHENQPVVLLSYGKEVEHGNTRGWYDPMSQQAQARYFLLHYAVVRESGIAGSFISSFADWTGDRPILTVDVKDPYVYPLGLVSERREKRLAFDMVAAQYGDERTAALPPGSQKTEFPVAHVLTGFVVILIVGYQYAYNRRFSEAVKRALLRSYNFYSDLRDFHAISIVQTIVLSLLISVTLAVVFSGIFYHYRSDRFFDFVLTYVVVSDFLKHVVIRATWNPLQGILFFAAVFFFFSLVASLLVKLCSFFVRAKIRWYHAYGVTVWSAMPVIFLSPVGMSLSKIMENPVYVLPSLAVVAVFLLWTLVRIISGIAVVYDISHAKTYIGSLVVIAILLGGVFLYYESTFDISASIKYAFDLSKSIG
ncbi:MAG TPA: glycoside hydrolase family 2 TIM barrel-domain containing protein, partial [Bacteroidota bacterium]|nr:glycoside hydrolase family 2 TIM barrel-domain containing protein [Bacteroidota bacterium]